MLVVVVRRNGHKFNSVYNTLYEILTIYQVS